MNKQVLLTLEDGDLADVRGGWCPWEGGYPGYYPNFEGGGYNPYFSNLNYNQNSATAVSTLIGPISLGL